MRASDGNKYALAALVLFLIASSVDSLLLMAGI